MVRDGKRSALLVVIALVALISVWRCFFVVDETEWAVVLRFGKLVKVVEDAGLHFRLPIDSVRKFDKRLQVYNPPATEFLTGDKKNLVLDVYVVGVLLNQLGSGKASATLSALRRESTTLFGRNWLQVWATTI